MDDHQKLRVQLADLRNRLNLQVLNAKDYFPGWHKGYGYGVIGPGVPLSPAGTQGPDKPISPDAFEAIAKVMREAHAVIPQGEDVQPYTPQETPTIKVSKTSYGSSYLHVDLKAGDYKDSLIISKRTWGLDRRLKRAKKQLLKRYRLIQKHSGPVFETRKRPKD